MSPSGKTLRLRKILLILLGVAVLSALGCSHRPTTTSHVVLSYYENPSWCRDCPAFQVDFQSGGHVDFHGLRGCAVPGVQHSRIPEAEFTRLVQAFRDADFFQIPRLDVTRAVTDVTVFRLTYRDERRIHETVDDDRRLPRLTQLEKQLRNAASIDRFLNPSVALYEQLLSSGWDVNTLGEDHENALTSAVIHNDIESVRFLMRHGATISQQALFYARSPDIAKLLLAATHLDVRSPIAARLLIRAADSNAGIMPVLLEKGVPVNSHDQDSGRTPLMAAVSRGSRENVELLLSKGADLNAADRAGRTALWFAASQTNSGFITLLAQHGAQLNAQDSSGRTALMQASDLCWYWNIQALLSAGADPSIADRRGRTALQPELAAPGDPKCKTSRELLEAALRERALRQ